MATEKNDVVSAFIKARDALYEHFGFEEDWVMYPLNFEALNDLWCIRDDEIHWWRKENKDDYYSADIFRHRFYPKGSIFRGSEFTMIFGHPHVDGMTWAYIFKNKNESKIRVSK
jgi:hypothetical protein